MAELSGADLPDEVIARFDGLTEPADVRRVGVADRDRAVPAGARAGRARPALLHAQPVPGDARDLRGAAHHGLTVVASPHAHRHRHRPGHGPRGPRHRRRPRRRRATAPPAWPRRSPAPTRPPTEIVAVGREHTDAARIASTNLNVWPAYDNEGKPSGFEARHSLSITCTDVSRRRGAAGRAGHRGRRPAAGRGRSASRSATPGARAGPRPARRRTPTRWRAAGHLAELAGARLGEVQAMAEGGAPCRRRWPTWRAARDDGEVGRHRARRDHDRPRRVTVTFVLDLSGQAGPTSWATSAADRPTNGSPAPGVACAPAAYTPGTGVAGPSRRNAVLPALPQHARAATRPTARPGRGASGRPA